MTKVRLPVSPGHIENISNSAVIAIRPEVATSFLARGRGLMFRSSFEHGGAMIINPCSSIHMFFMRFPIDVLYLDGEHRVVRAQSNIKPWRIGPLRTKGAKYVIELPAGTISRTGTEVGDAIRIT